MTGSPHIVPLPYSPDEVRSSLGGEWESTLRSVHRWMLLGRVLDTRMLGLQRQGRVGFYGAATGQEAVNAAAGVASGPDDWVLPGLREQLVALVRGHPLTRYVDHLFANSRDPALGRNMPCHPTASEVHYVSMSSVIGTQVSHAVGVGYAMRRRKSSGAVLAFFGDGATSANDVHAGLNFASVWGVPVVFCCTNNQWAISQPVARQSAVATLAEKARAYALPGARVDGTDAVAVYRAVREALGRARDGRGPTFLEFVVFRMTAHSSSDDPRRYQPADWADRAAAHDPVDRLESWLTTNGVLSTDGAASLRRELDESVRSAIESAERTPVPDPSTLTSDVFASPSRELPAVGAGGS